MTTEKVHQALASLLGTTGDKSAIQKQVEEAVRRAVPALVSVDDLDVTLTFTVHKGVEVLTGIRAASRNARFDVAVS